MSMIFGTVEIPDDMDTDMSSCSDMPPDTIRDEIRADEVVVESEAETDEEQLGVHEETTYEGLTKVKEAMVTSAVQTLFRETFMAGSSGASVAVTPGTDAQDQSVTLCIDTPINRATE
uniref:Polyprotein protein n=1 Tax=Solanum tuberosum TaxID=4113 RepID=M1DHC4_SOLTU